jgi:hypothetical protein
LENLVAGASEVDIVFEHHVGVLVKAIVLRYDCRASLGSMQLRVQIDLSEESDGVGHGVLAVRIEYSALRWKRELEIEHALEVVIRLSGSIESEVAEGVLRSESPRKALRVETIGRLDHSSEERELT